LVLNTSQRDKEPFNTIYYRKDGDPFENDSDPEMNTYSKRYMKMTEQDLPLRRSHRKYERLRELEQSTIAANNSKPNFKAYVLLAGVIYGNGEDLLFDLFKV
jgi:adenylate kinase